MSVAYAPSPTQVTPTDRLSITLFLALCAHLILVFGVSFIKEDRPRHHTSSIDIVLVQRKTAVTPKQADFIGQANQLGSGQQHTRERPSTPLPSPLLSNTPDLAASNRHSVQSTEVLAPVAKPTKTTPQPPAATTAQKRPVIASRKSLAKDKLKQRLVKAPAAKQHQPSKIKARAKPPAKTAARIPSKTKPKATAVQKALEQPRPTLNAATLVRRSLAMASLSAEVNRSLNAYAKQPRRKWISASTRESKYAAYMESWRTKVERIGNLNYPDEARRRRLSGSLLMVVAIKADGSVKDVTLRRSSGHKVLDDAARRIVLLAAPFARFPKSIRKETDILYIQRTWRFSVNHRFASR